VMYLPRSRPWTDPRWHQREHPISVAKKMETHSYGILCLWLLLEDRIVEYLGNTPVGQEYNSEKQSFIVAYDAPLTKLELLQRNGTLTSVIRHILTTDTTETGSEETHLAQFFDSVLPYEYESRESNFMKLISLLPYQPKNNTDQYCIYYCSTLVDGNIRRRCTSL
jgi:hypothetical protein